MRPGCERPRAYEDDSMQAEYDRWVRPEIERRYVAELDVIRDALSADDELLVLTNSASLPARSSTSARTAGRRRRPTNRAPSSSSAY